MRPARRKDAGTEPERHPTVVFLGPSLPIERARELVDASFRPPARRGDVYALLAQGVQTVILVDGLFHGQPSVWQRELLAALDEGIAIVGASSMGALRAAELWTYGVIGHGRIFEWYRDELIDGDDEVALRHAGPEDGYRGLSVPLVNIRATLAAAEATGQLARVESEGLLEHAKSIYYPNRAYPALLQSPVVAQWPPERRAGLERFFREHAVDLKRLDALSALRAVATQRPERPARIAFNESATYLEERLKHRRVVVDGRSHTGEEVLRDIGEDEPLFRKVLQQSFILRWARDAGLIAPAEHHAAFAMRHQATHGTPSLEAFLRANALSEHEYEHELDKAALVDWVRTRGPAAFGLSQAADLGEDAFVLDWAERHGLGTGRSPAERVAWLYEQGLEGVGFQRSFSLSADVFRYLQLTGALGAVLRRSRP